MNAFGLPVMSGGQSRPYVKYDARSGRISAVDRVQNAQGTWESNVRDVTANAVMAVDFANVRTGWLYFPNGAAPVKHLVKMGEALPPRPADVNDKGQPVFKPGIEVDAILQGDSVVREFSTNANATVEGLGEVYKTFLAAPEAKAGKVPVIQMTGVRQVKAGQSTNYEPIFQVVSWIDRPPLFDKEREVQPVAAPTPAPAAATGGASGFGFG